MSRLYRILPIFFFLLSTTLFVFADNSDDTFVLVIDPGHGGHDPGAVGKTAKEKDINLAVSKLAGGYIANEHKDVKVVYTRQTDVYLKLEKRTEIANKANADLFISIHSNASKTKTTSGAEVFILGNHRTKDNLEVAKRENSVILLESDHEQKYKGFDPNSAESYIIFEFMQNKYVEQSLNFASAVQKELVKTANRKDRGVKQAGFWVLVGAAMPRVLVELDFISNIEAEKYISSKNGQEKMARAIANAFTQYKSEYDHRKNGSVSSQNTTKEETVNEDVEGIANGNIKEEESSKTTDINSALTYKVQILVSPKKLAANSSELKKHKADFYLENNLYKYTYGESSDWDEISKIRKSLLKDFKDAFIVTFRDGVKVVPNK